MQGQNAVIEAHYLTLDQWPCGSKCRLELQLELNWEQTASPKSGCNMAPLRSIDKKAGNLTSWCFFRTRFGRSTLIGSSCSFRLQEHCESCKYIPDDKCNTDLQKGKFLFFWVGYLIITVLFSKIQSSINE